MPQRKYFRKFNEIRETKSKEQFVKTHITELIRHVREPEKVDFGDIAKQCNRYGIPLKEGLKVAEKLGCNSAIRIAKSRNLYP